MSFRLFVQLSFIFSGLLRVFECFKFILCVGVVSKHSNICYCCVCFKCCRYCIFKQKDWHLWLHHFLVAMVQHLHLMKFDWQTRYRMITFSKQFNYFLVCPCKWNIVWRMSRLSIHTLYWQAINPNIEQSMRLSSVMLWPFLHIWS